jgi:hypothetical protein
MLHATKNVTDEVNNDNIDETAEQMNNVIVVTSATTIVNITNEKEGNNDDDEDEQDELEDSAPESNIRRVSQRLSKKRKDKEKAQPIPDSGNHKKRVLKKQKLESGKYYLNTVIDLRDIIY